jgi:cardiolipin synthase
MGGMNIADRYIHGSSVGPWRDTHFKITGKGVHGLQSAFLIDWYVISKQLVKGSEYYPSEKIYSDNILQIAASGPTGPWRTLVQAFLFCIMNARKYLYIQTPYFLPTEDLNQALQTVALSGVDVRLMIPERSDTWTANMASRSFLDDMVKAGVKVYFYKPGFLHSKLFVMDDALSCIGSANFDFRSFEHNFEINAFVYQASFAGRMKAMFMDDLTHCEQLVPARWLKRPLPRRLAESFMRLFSPLL